VASCPFVSGSRTIELFDRSADVLGMERSWGWPVETEHRGGGTLRWARANLCTVALSLFLLLYLGWQAFGWLPLDRRLAGEALLLAIWGAATCASALAFGRSAGWRGLRRAWGLVMLAELLGTLGLLAQALHEQLGPGALHTLSSSLYLSSYPLLLVGVLSFPAAPLRGREAMELALDCAVVTLGGGAVFAYLILGPEAVTAHGALETVTAVVAPIGDIVLLVALGSTLLRGAPAVIGRSLRPMAVALGLFAVADVLYGYELLHGTYRPGDPLDTLYVLAGAFFVASASRQRRPTAADTLAALAIVPRVRGRWLPYAAIVAALVIAVVKERADRFFPDLSMGIVVSLTAALALVRQALVQVELRRSSQRLAQAQEIAHIGSWEWDVERDIVRRSEEDLRIYGVARERAPTTHAATERAIHPEDRERVHRLFHTALERAQPFSYEMRIVRPDGEVRTVLSRGEVETRGGRVTAMRGTHQDITDRKRMESQLRYEAQHDPLTGLYNRQKLTKELDRALRYSSRYARPGALLIFDVDDFKVLNDTEGPGRGDELLKAIGQGVLERMRASDIVARLDGDEFAIVLPEVDRERALVVAEDLREVLACQMQPPVEVSAGLVLFDGAHGMMAEDALIAADIALYEAKEQGKNQVRLYDGASGAAVTWVERIRAALEEDRFVLYGQPIVELRSGAVVRHELLIRMLDEEGRLVMPGEFLPVAERFGLMREIDRWVVREGLRVAAGGRAVSINLSAHSIGDGKILAELRAALAGGLRPERVLFEITETAAMENMQEAREFTDELLALGCELALDDFGTGFGSFTYLKYLPARYLKIDMEFVREMARNETDRQVVDAITKVAHSLGKLTIAEGVEDAETMRALREFGVDVAQGFHLGRPQPVAGAPSGGAVADRARLAKIGG
jgi:diguanylate cyclase (GGDEF)-like protein/PAS domain S-box-containing protein